MISSPHGIPISVGVHSKFDFHVGHSNRDTILTADQNDPLTFFHIAYPQRKEGSRQKSKKRYVKKGHLSITKN